MIPTLNVNPSSPRPPRRGPILRLSTTLAWWLSISALSAPLVPKPVETQDSAGLSRALKASLRSRALRRAQVGLAVMDIGSGQWLFQHNGEQPLLPASNQKLFVTWAALSRWDADHQFETRLYRRGRIDSEVLWGDLYLEGRGDPGLRTDGLYEMAGGLSRAGIKKIAGDLVFDDFAFEEPQHRFVGGASARVYYAPTGALSLNYNIVSFLVRGLHSGRPADVVIDAPGSFLDLRNRVRTATSTRLGLTRKVTATGNQFNLWGTIGVGRARRLRRAITDPSGYCVAAFTEVLSQMGIQLQGTVRRAPRPPDSQLLHAQPSRSLGELLYDQNKASNNFLADQLLLLLALEHSSRVSHGEAALFLEQELRQEGLNQTLVGDGSGLSRNNLTTATDIVRLLRLAYHAPFGPEFVASLPIAGRDGTLGGRLKRSETRGWVRAKTGHLSGVSTLSGFVFRADGRILGFSILVNKAWSGSRAIHRAQDQIVHTLSEIELP